MSEEEKEHTLLNSTMSRKGFVAMTGAAGLAAEQLVDRHAGFLALDIPQRHVDPAHRASADRAKHAMAHHRAHHPLP